MTPGGPLGVQNIEKLTLIIEKGLYNITFSLIRFRGSGSAAQAARPLQYIYIYICIYDMYICLCRFVYT